jgi:hypothetical protein
MIEWGHGVMGAWGQVLYCHMQGIMHGHGVTRAGVRSQRGWGQVLYCDIGARGIVPFSRTWCRPDIRLTLMMGRLPSAFANAMAVCADCPIGIDVAIQDLTPPACSA